MGAAAPGSGRGEALPIIDEQPSPHPAKHRLRNAKCALIVGNCTTKISPPKTGGNINRWLARLCEIDDHDAGDQHQRSIDSLVDGKIKIFIYLNTDIKMKKSCIYNRISSFYDLFELLLVLKVLQIFKPYYYK